MFCVCCIMKLMKKNIIIAFILLTILILPEIFLRSEKQDLLATSILKLQKQIESLRLQVEKLTLKILNIELTGSDEKDVIPPLLQNLEPEYENFTDTTAILTWETDELSDSFVIYSTDYIRKFDQTKKVFTATNSDLVIFHEVQLVNLKPATKYYYYVSSADPSGNTSISNTHSIITKSSPDVTSGLE